MFTTELETGSIKATGSVEFDDMDNSIICISINGQTLTENKVSAKEFEVLRRYFAEVK
jgi:catabolite regulation protein CreA